MKDIKQQADEFAQSLNIITETGNGYSSMTKYQITKCAIASTEGTIELFEELKNSMVYKIDELMVKDFINQQTEILNELKSRL